MLGMIKIEMLGIVKCGASKATWEMQAGVLFEKHGRDFLVFRSSPYLNMSLSPIVVISRLVDALDMESIIQ